MYKLSQSTGGTPAKLEREYGRDKWISEVSFSGDSDLSVKGSSSTGKYRN